MLVYSYQYTSFDKRILRRVSDAGRIWSPNLLEYFLTGFGNMTVTKWSKQDREHNRSPFKNLTRGDIRCSGTDVSFLSQWWILKRCRLKQNLQLYKHSGSTLIVIYLHQKSWLSAPTIHTLQPVAIKTLPPASLIHNSATTIRNDLFPIETH